MRFSRILTSDWTIGALIYAPIFIATAIATSKYTWAIQGDMALEIMRARDVGENTPLLGAFSRYGWAHPGPILFYLFALPAKFANNPSLWVTLFGLVLKWIPLSASVVVIKRKLGMLPSAVFVAMSYLFLVNHRDSIWTIWNPTIGLSAFILLISLVATSSPSSSGKWILLWTLVLASILIQLHIGYLLPCAVAIVIVTWNHLRAPNSDNIVDRYKIFALSLVPSFILWIPPLIDQALETQNLSALVRFFVSDSADPIQKVGFIDALRIVSFQISPLSSWTGRSDLASNGQASQLSVFVVFIALAAISCLIFLTRRRDTKLAWLLSCTFIFIVISVIGVSQSSTPPYPYLFSWVTAISMWTWFAISAAVIRLASNITILRLAVVTCSIAVGITGVIGITHKTPPAQFESEAVEYFSGKLDSVIGSHSRVSVLPAEGYAGIGFGIMLELELQGKQIFVEPLEGEEDLYRLRMWGEHRISEPTPNLSVTIARGSTISQLLALDIGWQIEHLYAPRHTSVPTEFTATTPQDVVALMSRTLGESEPN